MLSSNSVFALLVNIPTGIASSEVVLKIFVITVGIKNYKSAVKKRKKA